MADLRAGAETIDRLLARNSGSGKGKKCTDLILYSVACFYLFTCVF